LVPTAQAFFGPVEAMEVSSDGPVGEVKNTRHRGCCVAATALGAMIATDTASTLAASKTR